MTRSARAPRLTGIFCRARSMRFRRIASAAVAKKWARPSKRALSSRPGEAMPHAPARCDCRVGPGCSRAIAEAASLRNSSDGKGQGAFAQLVQYAPRVTGPLEVRQVLKCFTRLWDTFSGSAGRKDNLPARRYWPGHRLLKDELWIEARNASINDARSETNEVHHSETRSRRRCRRFRWPGEFGRVCPSARSQACQPQRPDRRPR